MKKTIKIKDDLERIIIDEITERGTVDVLLYIAEDSPDFTEFRKKHNIAEYFDLGNDYLIDTVLNVSKKLREMTTIDRMINSVDLSYEKWPEAEDE